MGLKLVSKLKGRRITTGWRRSAKVNCVVLAAASVALAVLVIVLLARGSLKPLFFYEADCDSGKVAARNLALHLLINIASTLVVLNAPTRQEVDNAHLKSSWLGIGVPSVRNAFRVSRFKTWCWISLFLSSIPIHLLFNSAVFEVDGRESNFHLTIATEKFLHGGDFYPPGSSLAVPGLIYADDHPSKTHYYSYYSGWRYSPYDYGFPVNETDYQDRLSPVFSNVSNIAKKAAGWERLEISECKAEYVACRGLKKRGSVVLVVDDPDGWVGNDIWQLNETEAEYWAQRIPSAKPNHLFFDAQCAMVAYTTQGDSTRTVACENNCVNALGNINDQNGVLNTADWNYPFFNNEALYVMNGSGPYSINRPNLTTYYNGSWNHQMTSGLRQDTFNLNISYCLAEPLENICRIALSPSLLLGVMLCVVAKTITAIVVTIVLSRPEHKPLVTLGDAVASFIKHPDPVTAGLCTVNQEKVRAVMRQEGAHLVPGPRPWILIKQRWATTIPISVWLSSYALFASGVTTCSVLLYEGLSVAPTLGSFLASDSNAFIPLATSLIEGVLLSNSPQLLLSFCYLAYNNLFTRLQMAKEWARFGEGYNPLRVTEPRGQQYSTYRLQLPYKYSIPLMVVSASLHWLVSNTIYVFVSTGGYFGTSSFSPTYGSGGDPSLPPNTAVTVGYSLTSLVVLITVSSVLVAIPPILAFKKFPSNITQPGSNSLAISAACQSSTLSRAVHEPATAECISSSHVKNTPSSYAPIRTRSSADLDGDLSSQRSPGRSSLWRPQSYSTLRSWFSEERTPGKDYEDEDEDDDGDMRSPLRRLAQSRLRWGVIAMPAEWYDEYDYDRSVGHLGFGVAEDKPEDPVPGNMYA